MADAADSKSAAVKACGFESHLGQMEERIAELVDAAKKYARRSPCRFKHAALILDKNLRVLSYGVNAEHVHAEIAAFRKLPRRKRYNRIVISVRLTQGGHDVSYAKPCGACLKIINRYRSNSVFYTTRTREIELLKKEHG